MVVCSRRGGWAFFSKIPPRNCEEWWCVVVGKERKTLPLVRGGFPRGGKVKKKMVCHVPVGVGHHCRKFTENPMGETMFLVGGKGGGAHPS